MPRRNDGGRNLSLAQRAPFCTSASRDLSHAASLNKSHAKSWAADANASNHTNPPTHLVDGGPVPDCRMDVCTLSGWSVRFSDSRNRPTISRMPKPPGRRGGIDIPRSIRIGGQSTALLRAALAWAARGSMADGQETMGPGGEGKTTPTSAVMYGDFRAAKEGAEEVNNREVRVGHATAPGCGAAGVMWFGADGKRCKQ